MNSGEEENPVKRADIMKLLSAVFDVLNERIQFFHTLASDCRDAGTNASQLSLYLQNSPSNPDDSEYSMGMANPNYIIYAWDSTHIWRVVCSTNDIMTITNNELIKGATVPDYSTLTLANIHIMIMQATAGFGWGADEMAVSAEDGGINATDAMIMKVDSISPTSGAGTYWGDGDPLEGALNTLCTALDLEHDSTGGHRNDVIDADALAKDTLVASTTSNFINGGMEFQLLPDVCPKGWIVTGSPTTCERSSTQKHGGVYSLKVVATGSLQGAYYNVATHYVTILKDAYIAYSMWVYSSINKIRIKVDDGISTQFIDKDVIVNTWTKIDGNFALNTTATKLEFHVVSTDAQTFYMDEVQVNLGKHSFSYQPSDEECGRISHLANKHHNLMLNADFSIFPVIYSGGVAQTIYPPFAWQLKEAAGVKPAVCEPDTTNAQYGENCILLKLKNTNKIFSECFAPNTQTARRFWEQKLTFVVDILDHNTTPGTDPIKIYIRDSGGPQLSADITKAMLNTTTYTRFYVTKTIDAAATYIEVGIINTAGTTDNAEFYVGSVQCYTGDFQQEWQPGDYHKCYNLEYMLASDVVGTYFRHDGLVCSTAIAPVIRGTIVGIDYNVNCGTAPDDAGSVHDIFELCVAGGLVTTAQLAVLKTTTYGESQYTIPKTDIPTINSLPGAMVAGYCVSVATTPGTNTFMMANVWVIC